MRSLQRARVREVIEAELYRHTEFLVLMALDPYLSLETRPKAHPDPEESLVLINSKRLHRILTYEFTILCMGPVRDTPGALFHYGKDRYAPTPLARTIVNGTVSYEMDRRGTDRPPSEQFKSWFK